MPDQVIQEILNAESIEVHCQMNPDQDRPPGTPPSAAINVTVKYGGNEMNVPTITGKKMLMAAVNAVEWQTAVTKLATQNRSAQNEASLRKQPQSRELALTKAALLLLKTSSSEQEAQTRFRSVQQCNQDVIEIILEGLASRRGA